jgi:hypothetical protein
VERYVQQASDQGRVAAQSVGERIVFQSLFFEIEEKRRRFQPKVEPMKEGFSAVCEGNRAYQENAQHHRRAEPRGAA